MTELPSTDHLVDKLAERLLARGWQLVVAESCTGGRLGAALTRVPGASNWFERGYITYSNVAKVECLSVSWKLLEEHGAVSQAVAEAMAVGALTASKADLSAAITGIAGPSGGESHKPVGTVWIAWAKRNEPPCSQCFHFPADRDSVQAQSVTAAITGLLNILQVDG